MFGLFQGFAFNSTIVKQEIKELLEDDEDV
jgi:hypothetical protein